MPSAELIRTEQEAIPNWAPVISADPNVFPWLESINFSYEEMAALMEDEEVSRQEMQNLWIYISEYPYYHLFDRQGSCGIFLPRDFINEPKNEKYRNGLQKLLSGNPHADFDFSKYSFILLDIPAISIDVRAQENPAEEVKYTLIHELLHFTEDTKLNAWWDAATNEEREQANLTEIVSSLEEVVTTKENEIRQTKRYERILVSASGVFEDN